MSLPWTIALAVTSKIIAFMVSLFGTYHGLTASPNYHTPYIVISTSVAIWSLFHPSDKSRIDSIELVGTKIENLLYVDTILFDFLLRND